MNNVAVNKMSNINSGVNEMPNCKVQNNFDDQSVPNYKVRTSFNDQCDETTEGENNYSLNRCLRLLISLLMMPPSLLVLLS